MSKKRAETRYENLLEAKKKLSELLKESPKSPKASAWKARLAEYEQSLKNFKEFGEEVVTEKSDVNIDVPKGTFKATVH